MKTTYILTFSERITICNCHAGLSIFQSIDRVTSYCCDELLKLLQTYQMGLKCIKLRYVVTLGGFEPLMHFINEGRISPVLVSIMCMLGVWF